MKFEDLLFYQPVVMSFLNKAFEKNKFAHAYLFDGDNGTGKKETAEYFAKKFLCTQGNKPCMKCSDCKQIDNHAHINCIYITAENDLIKKEQIERLIHNFSLTSSNGLPQIYIIDQAEKMNISASNALLKFLEEPMPNRYAFILTNNKSKMLDTIISRCQVLLFSPIPKELLIKELLECGIEKDVAYISSFLTNERSAVLKYIEEGRITNYLTIAKKILDKNLRNKDCYVEYFRNRSFFLEEKDRANHRFFLDILLLILEEVLKKLDGSKELYFSDVLQSVDAEKINKEQIIRKIEDICVYQERFNSYVNYDLQYTSLFSKL